MKKKKWVGLGLLLILGGASTFDLITANAATTQANTNLEKIQKIYDSEEEFFSKPIKEVDLVLKNVKLDSNEIKNSIVINNNKIQDKKESIDNKIKTTEKKVKAEKELNQIFNDELDLKTNKKDIVIDDEQYSKEKMDKITSEFKDDSKFSKQITYYVTIAKKQKQLNDEAKQALKKIFDNNKVVSTNKKDIDEAKNKIAKLPESKFKQSLLNNLEKVNKQYNDEQMIIKDKEEQEKANQDALDEKESSTALEQKPINNDNEVVELTPTIQEPVQEPIVNNQPVETPTPEPTVDTSGFSARGISAPLSTYGANGGQVPTYTPYVYLWTNSEAISNYYLIDNSNTLGLGNIVASLSNGETVYLNGHSYTVTGSQIAYYGQDTSVIESTHNAYLQTCLGSNPSVDGMRIVFLD